MRKLQLLKALIDLFFFLMIIGTVGLLVFIPFILFSTEPFDLPLKINGEILTVVDFPSKILLVIALITGCFFTYGIYLLRKLLTLFSKKQIFEEQPIILLNKIGKCFLLTSLLTGIISLLFNIVVKKTAHIEFGGEFGSFLFTASLGLFFMVLSEVFRIGKTMKEENELTV